MSERFRQTTGRDSWGRLLEHIRAQGGQLLTREFNVEPGMPAVELAAVVRVEGGTELFFPVNRDRPLDARVGFGMMARICSALKITEPDDWPRVL